MHRRTLFAIAVALAAAAVAGACSSGGAGLNFGCGPDDPCCAKGSYMFDCKRDLPNGCGNCDSTAYNDLTIGPVVISPAAARDGGTITVFDAGLPFHVGTCSASEQWDPYCRQKFTFYFGSNGPSLDIPNVCYNTSSQTCSGTCGTTTCTAVGSGP